MMTERKWVNAAQAAIDAHRASAGIIGDHGVQLWHLLASLRTWCNAHDIDFDTVLEEVKRFELVPY